MNVPNIYSEKTNIRSISDEIIRKSKKLVLKVVEGPILKGVIIKINAAGILGGKRCDGVTYFG